MKHGFSLLSPLIVLVFTIPCVLPKSSFSSDSPCCTNLPALLKLSEATSSSQIPFRLVGTFLGDINAPAFVSDDYGISLWFSNGAKDLQAGNSIQIEGYCTNRHFRVQSFANLSDVGLPQPMEASVQHIQQGLFFDRYVRTHGTIIDAFRDDIDSGILFVIISSGNAQVYGAVPLSNPHNPAIHQMIGAEVNFTGICTPPVNFQRRYVGCVIQSWSMSTLEIIKPAITDPEKLPKLKNPAYASPQDIFAMGQCHVSGVVQAVMSDSSFLLRDDDGHLHRITPDIRYATPKVHDIVIAGGLVRTDFYLINLTHAICTVVGHSDEAFSTPISTSAETVLYDAKHEKQFKPSFYGQTIRLIGKVVRPSVQTPGDRGFLNIDDNSHAIPVDISSSGLSPENFPAGSVLSVTGICMMDVENWTPSIPFSKIKGFTVVVRVPDDIQILSLPSWWNPKRSLTAICLILFALFTVLVWNHSLRRHIEKRTKELLDEQVAHARSEFRTAERTNLAIELHDTLSQDLAAVAFQIDATNNLMQSNPLAASHTLDTLETMLHSCRTELKRCLWDLRNETLEDSDLTHAIQRTLQPLVVSCNTAVRFNVPRNCLTDSSTHAILCIIRELVSNALLHGKATAIKIAGSLDHDRILFSVIDNGIGFNPSNHPGPDSGHFGLAGVETRAKRLHGEVKVQSRIGKGTHVKVAISISEPQDK